MATNPFNGFYELSPEYPRGFNSSLSFITPFTHRTNISYAELLFELYKWLRENHLPELDSVLKTFKEQYETDFNAVKDDIEATKQSWIEQFNLFMDNVVSELEALNDQAMINLINNPTTQTHLGLVALIKANSLDEAEATLLIKELSLDEDEVTTLISELSLNDSQVKTLIRDEVLNPLGEIYTDENPRGLSFFRSLMGFCTTEPVYMVVLGSSTSRGAAASAGMGYAWQLTRKIGKAFPMINEPVEYNLSEASQFREFSPPGFYMANGSDGGLTSRNYCTSTKLTQISNISQYGKIFVLHMIGANDIGYNFTPQEYENNIRTAIGNIDALVDGNTVHILVHSFSRQDISGASYSWSEYRDVLKRITADKPTNRIFIDTDREYQNVGVPGDDPLKLVTSDNVHQTEAGHTLTATIIADKLKLNESTKKVISESPFFDNFTDTDGVVITSHTPNLGDQKWKYIGGSTAFDISDNSLRSLGNNGLIYVDGGSVDVEVTARVKYGSPGTRGVFARCNPENGQRISFYLAAGRLNISRTTSSGVNDVLAGIDFVNTSSTDDFVLSLECIGKYAIGRVNGEVSLAVKLSESVYSFNMNQTSVGIRATGTGAVLYDSFSCIAR